MLESGLIRQTIKGVKKKFIAASRKELQFDRGKKEKRYFLKLCQL